MGDVQKHTHVIGGVTTHFVPVITECGEARIYLLSSGGVPAYQGSFPKERLDAGEAWEMVKSRIPPEAEPTIESRAHSILRKYQGRQGETMNVLCHSLDQGRFGEFADRLEQYSEINRLPPYVRFARTDVTAFFMRLYDDLGVGDEVTRWWIKFDKRFGAGIVVLGMDEVLPHQRDTQLTSFPSP